MFVYSVYDKKSMFHDSMFFARSDAEAARAVSREANNSNSNLNRFPYDFALYCVGEFDFNTGSLSGFTPLKIVAEVSSFISTDKNNES